MQAHPFDRVLRQNNWARQTLSTLPGRKQTKADVRLLVITVETEEHEQTCHLVDVRMWQQNSKASIERTGSRVPSVLEPILITSLIGVKPIRLGLSQCHCMGQPRWNPYMLPLVHHATMTADRLRIVIGHYMNLVRSSQSWMCPDTSHRLS